MNKPDPAKVNVVILAGGKGTRIREVAPNTSKALLEIAGVPALVLIMRNLIRQNLKHFTVVVNESNKNTIESVIKSAFEGINMDFKTVVQPQAMGPAHAFFYGLHKVDLENETLLCLSDTLFDEELPTGYDWVGTSLAKGDGKWCWVETKNKRVIKFFDKIEPPNHVKEILIGLYYFRDSAFVYKNLDEIIKSGTKTAESEYQLSQLLDQYQNRYSIKSLLVDSWVDCGTKENYFSAQEVFTRHRSFNSVEIKNESSTKYVVKTGNKDKIRNEISWFNLVAKQSEELIPKVQRISTNSYKTEFISAPLLSSLYLYGAENVDSFLKIIKQLYQHIDNKLWRTLEKPQNINLERDCRSMYEIKPFKRLAQWLPWKEFKKSSKIKVNNQPIENVQDLFLNSLELSSSKKHQPIAAPIHGDFHFGNIFCNTDSAKPFILIDPRGKFGNSTGIVGDLYYDLAKLRHSYHGMYNAVVDGLYKVEQSAKNDFTLQIGPTRAEYIEQIDNFISSLGFDIEVIKSIELGILLSLIPLHQESAKNQLAFFLQAILSANELSK